jgi:cytochrome c-type biogenesis protein
MQSPELYIAFIAGLLSFLSPCVLPLVPAYIGYLSGSVVRSSAVGAAATPGGRGVAATVAVQPASVRWAVVMHALVFVIGFTLVFAILGGLVGSLREVFAQYRQVIQQVMGVLLVIFGLHMIGLINIPFLNYERRLGDKLRPASNLGYLRSLLIGIGFGAGWTPCIGPTLGLIFTMSISGQQSEAIVPFLAYSVGLGIPFLLTAMAMGRISAFLKKLTRRSYSVKIGKWTAIDRVNIVSLISGGLLVIMGILVFGNWLTLIAPPVTGFNV